MVGFGWIVGEGGGEEVFSEEEERRHSRGNINSDLKNQMLTRYVKYHLQLGLSRGWMDCGMGGEEGFSEEEELLVKQETFERKYNQI